MKKLLLLVFLASRAHAGDIIIGSFSGLNSMDNPIALEDGEAQDLLNVSLTPGGKSVYKRQGYGLHQTLSYSTSAVHGLHYFQDTAGSNIHLYGHDAYLAASVNGTSPVDIATGTVDATWQCTDNSGYAYCLNSSRDTAVRTSGTSGTTSFIAGIPKGTMITNTPDRLVVSGVSGAESSLYFSQANTFTNFTVGINSADPFIEVINAPGSRITHIRYACGKVLWWKDGSFGYTIGSDQFNLENVTISQNIGSLDNSSDEYNGIVYFRGQDNHIYQYDCSNVTRLSRKITPTVQGSSRRRANSWTQTTQSDFGGGSVTLNGPSLALSTAIVSGDVRPSSITITDTSGTDFNLGSPSPAIDTMTVSGAFTLKTYLGDTFANMGNWTQATGTSCGAVSTASGFVDFDEGDHNFEQVSSSSPVGDFIVQFDFKDTNSAPAGSDERLQFGLLNSSLFGYVVTIESDDDGTNSFIVYLSSSVTDWDDGSSGCTGTGGSSFFPAALGFLSSATITYDTSWHTLKFARNSTTDALQVYLDGVLGLSTTNGSYTSFSKPYFSVRQAAGLGHFQLDNFYFVARTGNFTSRNFDTSFSTPVWGTFTGTGSGNGTFTYATRSSVDGSTFDSDVALATGAVITSSAKRYLIYSSTLTTTAATSLPQVTDISVVAASTGTYYSAVNSASELSSWGTFTASDQTDGGTLTYYVRASTGIFTINSSTPAWTLQSKNATVNYATSTYMQARVDFGVTIATEATALNDFTFNWFEGNAIDKAYIKYWNDHVWVAVSSGSTGLNNRIQRWDILNQTWLLDDIPSNGFLVDTDSLYIGSPSSGKIYKYGDEVTTDDSQDIHSYWKSKNFAGDDPFVDKTWDQSDFVVKAAYPTVMQVIYQLDGSTSTTSYTMNLYSPSKTILHKGVHLAGKHGWFYNVQFGDTSSNEAWSVFGYRAKYTPWTWRPE